jgi:hypothetical protein
MGRVDASGRVCDSQVMRAPGWAAGERLTITAANGVILARRDPSGLHVVGDSAHLAIPAALEAALSLGDEVLAVSVQFHDDQAAALQADWDRWKPGVRLVILHPATRSITAPILDYLGSPEIRAHRQVLVLLPEVEPSKWRHRILQNQRDIILADGLRRHSNVNVASVPFRLTDD